MVKRRQVDRYRYCVGSYKVIATPQLDFVSGKYRYAYYYILLHTMYSTTIAVDKEWESQAIAL